MLGAEQLAAKDTSASDEVLWSIVASGCFGCVYTRASCRSTGRLAFSLPVSALKIRRSGVLRWAYEEGCFPSDFGRRCNVRLLHKSHAIRKSPAQILLSSCRLHGCVRVPRPPPCLFVRNLILFVMDIALKEHHFGQDISPRRVGGPGPHVGRL